MEGGQKLHLMGLQSVFMIEMVRVDAHRSTIISLVKSRRKVRYI